MTSGHWSLGAGGRPWHTPSPTHCEPAGSRPAGPSRTKKNNETSENKRTRKTKRVQRSTPKSEETCRLGKEKSSAAYSRVGGRAKMSNHGKDSSRGLRSITRFPTPNSLAVLSLPHCQQQLARQVNALALVQRVGLVVLGHDDGTIRFLKYRNGHVVHEVPRCQ